MSLRQYRQKRNFKETSEPACGHPQAKEGLHFVVQKHDASHLHYDFRLELHGVLKSWAVPKGVPDDPSIKRLAIEVEDHPLDYQYFKGTIPKGNYGAGTVEIWDKGTYYIDKELDRRSNEKQIAEDLAKGHLKFHLEGKKLHGQFTLVRLRGISAKKTQWLLIKKPSENGKHPPIPIEKLPASSMPSSIKPMLATLVDEPFDRKGWIFEVKWDGYRILSQIKNHQVHLYTRNGNDYTQNFSAVAQELEKFPDAVLDGEMVVVDKDGISRFQLLQNYMKEARGQLVYYVFDMVYLDQHDLRKLPLLSRKELLKRLISGGFKHVRLSDHVTEKGKDFFKAAKKMGLEGMIAKNLSSTYQFGRRGDDWLKIKAIQEQEAVICGFTEPRGSRKNFGALILGLYENQKLKYVGHTGGGFDEALLKDLYGRFQSLITGQCPFAKAPKTNMPVTWIKPELLCEVKFQEWTKDGHMRQPIFLGLRQDKAPKETHAEIPTPKKQVLKDGPLSARKTQPSSGEFHFKFPVSHPDKIYWPVDGYTKGDLVQYYQDVASYILPYIKGRPQSLRRQPNGIADAGFFQKDINFKPPDWIKIFNFQPGSKKAVVHHLICNDKQSLAYLNNMGCIEINTWCSSMDKPMYPDFLVLDFDPVEVDFDRVIDVAREAHSILTKIKCQAFCKTSGSRGLHVYVPLKKKYTYDQTKDFCQMICMAINRQMPDITSLERSPQKRQGRVYLDYLQNHFTATMAAPYSLRPRPHAPVSTPLEWKEVKHGLRPDQFNLKNIFPRLNKKGDLWKGVLGPGIDMKKSLQLLTKLQ